MKKKKEEIISEGLQALGQQYPDAFVADMLTHFDDKVVLTFMTLYGGRILKVPSVDLIWKAYRNKVIIETLLVDNTVVVRQALSHHFGIAPATVRDVFYRHRSKVRKITNKTVLNIVETVYRKNVEIFHREMKKLFSDKYGIEYFSVHDSLQNPEDMYLLKEAKEKLIERCKEGIKKHPTFIGREYKIDFAIAKILQKIEESH
jgi:hypothetical protein